MIKEINMPMMAHASGGSSSDLTWDDIPSAGPCDIQSGRNVYIELNEDRTCTKASAGKILQFIKEGFMPVAKLIPTGPSDGTSIVWRANAAILSVNSDQYRLTLVDDHGVFVHLYAFSDALDKPFTVVARISSSDEGGSQTNN